VNGNMNDGRVLMSEVMSGASPAWLMETVRYYLDESTSRGGGQCIQALRAELTEWRRLRSPFLHFNTESSSMSSQPYVGNHLLHRSNN
jgi:hypothetical protein